LICFVRKSIFLASDNPSFAFDVILLWDIHSSNDSIYLFYDISKVSDCHVFYEFLYFIIDNCKPVGCHFLFCIAVIISWRHTIKIENRDLKWLIDTCNSVQSNLFYWRTNFPVSIYENAQTIPPFYNSNLFAVINDKIQEFVDTLTTIYCCFNFQVFFINIYNFWKTCLFSHLFNSFALYANNKIR
jgi:hypothetical protein